MKMKMKMKVKELGMRNSKGGKSFAEDSR